MLKNWPVPPVQRKPSTIVLAAAPLWKLRAVPALAVITVGEATGSRAVRPAFQPPSSESALPGTEMGPVMAVVLRTAIVSPGAHSLKASKRSGNSSGTSWMRSPSARSRFTRPVPSLPA